jgi:hypothetical protein
VTLEHAGHPVSEDELREMVRASIARLGAAREPERPAVHASFARLALVESGDAEGRCIIEPSVRCNHCGYCLSYGH